MDHILIDIKNCNLTLSQAMREINSQINRHPEWEIFMDGDRYAIVGRDRV